MVKTTVILEDDLYRELVDESVREYGSTRKLSIVINRRLRGGRYRKAGRGIHIKPIRLGRRITEKEVEKAIEEGWAEGIKWSA
jgi:hypothetical protein